MRNPPYISHEYFLIALSIVPPSMTILWCMNNMGRYSHTDVSSILAHLCSAPLSASFRTSIGIFAPPLESLHLRWYLYTSRGRTGQRSLGLDIQCYRTSQNDKANNKGDDKSNPCLLFLPRLENSTLLRRENLTCLHHHQS